MCAAAVWICCLRFSVCLLLSVQFGGADGHWYWQQLIVAGRLQVLEWAPALEWAEYTGQIRALALSTLAQGAGGARHTSTGSGAGMEVEPSASMNGQVVLLALDRARFCSNEIS